MGSASASTFITRQCWLTLLFILSSCREPRRGRGSVARTAPRAARKAKELEPRGSTIRSLPPRSCCSPSRCQSSMGSPAARSRFRDNATCARGHLPGTPHAGCCWSASSLARATRRCTLVGGPRCRCELDHRQHVGCGLLPPTTSLLGRCKMGAQNKFCTLRSQWASRPLQFVVRVQPGTVCPAALLQGLLSSTQTSLSSPRWAQQRIATRTIASRPLAKPEDLQGDSLAPALYALGKHDVLVARRASWGFLELGVVGGVLRRRLGCHFARPRARPRGCH